jgi:hypothetical protein
MLVTPATAGAVRRILHRDDPFEGGIAHWGMKPIPPMNATIFLTFVTTLVACRLALISDLLMVTIVLALLIVLVTTEPDSSECDQPHAKRESVPTTSSPDTFPAAPGIFAATRNE